jgi:hypothetical protein
MRSQGDSDDDFKQRPKSKQVTAKARSVDEVVVNPVVEGDDYESATTKSTKRARVAAAEESSSLSELDLSSDEVVVQVATKQGEDTCVICSRSLAELNAVQRNQHVNDCVDTTTCSVCGQSIVHLSIDARMQHAHRCATKLEEKTARERASLTLASNVKAGRNNVESSETYFCVVCEKDLSAASSVARMQHLKTCAKKHKMGPNDFREKTERLLVSKEKPQSSLVSNNNAECEFV